jgi:hypothetical protein
MAADADHLSAWTGAAIDEECRSAYGAYRSAKVARYEEYFGREPDRRDEAHAYKARDLEAALPEGWHGLADLIRKEELHRQHRSANSSQVLALGLLGAAAQSDPALAWLWEALGPLPGPRTERPEWRFEAAVSPELLNEHPRGAA